MSAEIADVSGGLLSFRLTGLLKHTGFAAAQQPAVEILQRQGKARFLLLIEDFTGKAGASSKESGVRKTCSLLLAPSKKPNLNQTKTSHP